MKHPRRYFTLIQSAKRHGVDPFAYLRDTLLRITAEPGTGPLRFPIAGTPPWNPEPIPRETPPCFTGGLRMLRSSRIDDACQSGVQSPVLCRQPVHLLPLFRTPQTYAREHAKWASQDSR